MLRPALLLLALMSLGLQGCALAAAAGTGAVVADEYEEARECGDEFDPIDDVVKNDGCR